MKMLHQHAPALPVTSISVFLPRTGVCLDPPHLQGVSQLMGQMLFMGAGGLSNFELNGRLERLGAAMGCSLANDHVSLRLQTLTENLAPALELFLLSILEPNFDQGEFERLQGELLSSWIADREEHKQLRAQEMYMQQLYRNAPNGYLPDGNDQGLRACTLDDVRAQHEKLFAGGEPFLAVQSDLLEKDVQARVAEKITLPRKGNGASYPWDGYAPARGEGRRLIIIPDPDTNTDEIMLGAFSARELDSDWHIHRLIAFIFGGDMNSRMFREIRGERGLSYGASCWYENMSGRCPRDQLSPFSMYTFPAAEHTAEALPLLISLYEELVAGGVTGEELRLAKDALSNSHPFLRDTPGKLLGLRIAQELYGVETDSEETNQARMEAVSQEDVLRVLQKTHHPEHLDMVLLGDVGRLEPLAAQISGVVYQEVRPYPLPPQDLVC
ncbi:MAG: pitrilysin family protein [SAR324 cluster bacterium]|nr:pitrilysin family protein [SAR324 cluster bacterium]